MSAATSCGSFELPSRRALGCCNCLAICHWTATAQLRVKLLNLQLSTLGTKVSTKGTCLCVPSGGAWIQVAGLRQRCKEIAE